MKIGIICIETEWQITKRTNRLKLNTEHLIKFVSEVYNIPVIYRRVATKSELQFYLKQFLKSEYEFSVLYFCFHGDTQSIHLEGDNIDLSLDDLIQMGTGVFKGKFVHFSSCRTLLGSPRKLTDFYENSQAKVVSGYTKSVDSYMSAVHDIALLGEYLSSSNVSALFKRMNHLYGGLEEKLGFRYFPDK